MSKILFTGFPGFLGSELLPRVLRRSPEDKAVCLVQGKFLDQAQARADEIVGSDPGLIGRIKLVEGDITRPDLGLEKIEKLQAKVREIYHLAAVYDLSVDRDVAMRVNLDGTRHVLDFAGRCPAFERFQYVSTCYVSGRYAGIFTEQDLIKGQEFNNFYEETKYLAEVEVQQRMAGGMPGTIYRPAVVVGNSKTGATQKYDGPYFVIRWLLKQPLLAVLPVIGDPKSVRVNLVPSDFIVDAITYLSGLDKSAGKVYQLADPNPLTVDELIRAIGRATKRHVIRIPALLGPAKFAIDHIPGVYRLMQIPSASIDYFVHPTHYTTDQTQTDLKGSGIAVPRFTSYLPNLVRFVREHPEIGSEAMA